MPDTTANQTDNSDVLEQVMLQPQKVEVDGKEVWHHDLDQVVALDKYIQSKRAMKKRGCGIRFSKLEAGGAVR